ncbi:MAG TPA: DMT family transporter [Streptosporangiaceae bacterium]|jgi:drug/metabolite transporter (DMT)-like permease
MTSRLPVVSLAVTVGLWASAFPAIRVGLDGLGVAGLSVLRLAAASAALAAAAPVLGVRRPRRRDLPLIALCGASGMTAYQLLLNWGEQRVAAGTASLLIAVAPVFSVLLAAGFLGERLTRRTLLGSAVALVGAAVVALAGGPSHFSASALVVLAAAAAQGLYHVASKPLLGRYTGLEVASYAMWAGTALAVPLAPAAGLALAHAAAGRPGGLAAAAWPAVYLGVLPSAVGFVTWGYAVARFRLSTATAALYLVPPAALVVSYAWLGEVPSPVAIAGGLVSVVGVVIISRRAARQAPAAPGQLTPGGKVAADGRAAGEKAIRNAG